MKLVTTPVKQAAPRPHLRGLEDDFGILNDDVFLLEGETHLFPEAVPVCHNVLSCFFLRYG